MLKSLALSLLLVLCCHESIAQTLETDVTRAGFAFRSVDVGGRSLRYLCLGQGSPTVIVEPGLGGESIESVFSQAVPKGWVKIIPEVQKITRICVYDRAGAGRSDKAPSPRTSLDIVADLHALLERADIPPPYLFAGHSFGGMNSRLFADRYPNDVAGMVLVDSTHPDLWIRWRAALPLPSIGERPELQTLREPPDLSRSNEWVDLRASADLVRETRSLGNMPLIVLTPSQEHNDLGFPDDLERTLRPIAFELQAGLVKLSSNAELVVAQSAGHNIHIDEPQLVVAAVLELIDQVRQR